MRQGGGIQNYIRNLVGAVLAQDKTNTYLLLSCERPNSEYSFPRANNVEARTVVFPDRYWFRWRLPFYSSYFSGPVDIYHGLNFVLPALKPALRKIVTIYDLSFLEYGEYASPRTVALLSKVVPLAASEADMVVTLTQEAARTLNEHYRTPLSKIAIVPAGVGEHFRRIADPVLLMQTQRKFELRQPFILSVGTLEPRKNHLGLIKAFHKAQGTLGESVMLAIAGGEGWLYEKTRALVSELHLERRVRFLGRVNDAELVTLYSLADAFAYPSFFEGFGIPPLEAMACGTPVLTSNASCMPEVVGDAALLVDPHDIDSIAGGIVRIIGDEQLREELRQRGYRQVQKYTWMEAGRIMLSVYHELHTGAQNTASEGARG